MLALSALAVAAAAYGATHPPLATAQSVQDQLPNFHSYVPAKPLTKKGAWRKDMRAAQQAWKKGNYTAAHAILSDLLARGNVSAAWYLGHMYQQGRGVPRDRARAFELYRQVARTLDSERLGGRDLFIAIDSLVRVADGYRVGIKSAGVKRDPGRAYRNYLYARGFKHPGAEHGMAMILLDGQGVSKSQKQAVKLLTSAARKGYAPSMSALGDLHWQGKLAKHSKARAIMWYMLAREHAGARQHVRLSARLDQMLGKASVTQRQDAVAMAQRWSERHSAGQTIRPISD